MPRFLINIHRPHGFDHASFVTPELMKSIDAVNDEMVGAGVREFVAGLRSPSEAKSIMLGSGGETSVSDRYYLDAENYVDGFWVISVADIDEAIEWGERAAKACQGNVEVRPIHG